MEKLVTRYVMAMLSIAEDNNALESTLDQAVFVRNVLDDPEIQNFFIDPDIPTPDKQRLIKESFNEKLDNNLMGFLELMVRKRRASLIVPVLSELIRQIHRKRGVMEAEVVSAKPLSEEQVTAINKILSEKTNMDIEVKTSVNLDLLGGFYILIDGRVFDSSIKSELTAMREQLKKGDYRGD